MVTTVVLLLLLVVTTYIFLHFFLFYIKTPGYLLQNAKMHIQAAPFFKPIREYI